MLYSGYFFFFFHREKRHVCKNLYTNFYSSFVCESSKQETTQKSFSRWMIKETKVYPYHEAIKQAIALQNNLDESPENYALWEKTVRGKKKSCILHDSICITPLKWQNYWNRKQVCGSKRFKGRMGTGEKLVGLSRATGGILVMMGRFCILTVSLSTSWLWYCSLVLQEAAFGRN